MTTLHKTSGLPVLVPGNPGAPGYWRETRAYGVENGTACTARNVVRNGFRVLSATSTPPAGAQPQFRYTGQADSLGQNIVELSGYIVPVTSRTTRYTCAPTYELLYEREWVAPVPATPDTLRLSGVFGWTGAARSIGSIAGACMLTFRVAAGASGVVCGLSAHYSEVGSAGIRYGFYCSGGSAQVIVAGTRSGATRLFSNASQFAVIRNAGVIRLVLDGYVMAMFAEGADTVGRSLYADASLYAGNDAVFDADLFSIPSTTIAFLLTAVVGRAPAFGAGGVEAASHVFAKAPRLGVVCSVAGDYVRTSAPRLWAAGSEGANRVNGHAPALAMNGFEVGGAPPIAGAAQTTLVTDTAPAFKVGGTESVGVVFSSGPGLTIAAEFSGDYVRASTPELAAGGGEITSYTRGFAPALAAQGFEVAGNEEPTPFVGWVVAYAPPLAVFCVMTETVTAAGPQAPAPGLAVGGSDRSDYVAAAAPALTGGGYLVTGIPGISTMTGFVVLRPSAQEAADASAAAQAGQASRAADLVADELQRLLAAIAAFAATDVHGRRRLIYAVQTDCREALAAALVAFDPGYTVHVSTYPPIIGFGILDVRW